MNDKELDIKLKDKTLNKMEALYFLAIIHFENQYLSRPSNPIHPPMAISELVLKFGPSLFPVDM